MKIVSFNLRCVWRGDNINAFIHRAGMIYEKIMKEQPDVIGFQEVVPQQYELLRRMLPEYELIGQFRNADYGGEGVYTAVRRDRYQLLRLDTFWLSPTPYTPGSRFEKQSECPRICVMTELRDRGSGKLFRVYNTHLDHVSEEARVLGMRVVLDMIDRNDNERRLPIFLLGDFNAQPDDEAIRMCAERYTDLTADIPGTFHNYGKCSCKIDYIFAPGELKAASSVWDDCHEGIYLSDHYPIAAEVDDSGL